MTPKEDRRKALIVGAGVAGPTAAYWLARHGWDVTVVETADGLRLGGQNIDITDAAREVVRRMGLEEAIKDRHTGEKGLRFVDENGEVSGSFPTEKAGSLRREIEILRGDLVELVAGACPDGVRYRFGLTVDSLDDRGDAVSARLSDGSQEDFDVVLAADGMNSPTRPKVIGPGDHEDYLGCWASYFTVPRLDRDDDWWRWYTSPTGVVAFLRPDNKGTMRASVNFLSDESDPPHMSLDEKKEALRDRLRGGGWECGRLADALDGVDDVFLGPLHQIKADAWSRGRCALVGDAGYCPTPYTGMGTTLAIIGAYVLANELAAAADPADAFAAYEEKFRGFAERSQELPPGVPEVAYAQSRFKVGLINAGASVAASGPAQAFASLFSDDGEAAENDFPPADYAPPAD